MDFWIYFYTLKNEMIYYQTFFSPNNYFSIKYLEIMLLISMVNKDILTYIIAQLVTLWSINCNVQIPLIALMIW